MTPREPDRYEAKARLDVRACFHYGTICMECHAAALRAAESSALERAAQEYMQTVRRSMFPTEVGAWLRALKSPAAAPAAEPAKVLRHVTPRTRSVGYYICEKCKAGDHSDHSPGWGGICIGCACAWLPAPPSEPAAPAPYTVPVMSREPEKHEEPVAPAPDLLEMLREAFSIVSLQAARNPVRFNIDLRDRMAAALATPAPAQGAEARIAELEKERDHWRGACIEAMVTGKYPVSPHDDDPQIKSLREAAEASFHGQAYAEKARQLREAEALLRECEEALSHLGTIPGGATDIVKRKLAARAAKAKGEGT